MDWVKDVYVLIVIPSLNLNMNNGQKMLDVDVWWGHLVQMLTEMLWLFELTYIHEEQTKKCCHKIKKILNMMFYMLFCMQKQNNALFVYFNFAGKNISFENGFGKFWAEPSELKKC